jgi:endoribonuclease Dicer
VTWFCFCILQQLKDAKVFQETLFNGVFAKLLCRDRQSEGSRIMGKNVLKIMEMKNLWVSSNMYFLLPIESDKFGVSQREGNIDWHCIRSCASGVTLFKYLFISETDNNVRDILEVLVNRTLLQYSDCKEETITLASGIHKASDLIDKAVVTVHTGKIYSVVEVIRDKTAESPFPKSKDPKVDHCCNYYDYFEKK